MVRPAGYDAHAGPWVAFEAVAGPGKEQENGPRQRALGALRVWFAHCNPGGYQLLRIPLPGWEGDFLCRDEG